MENVKGSVKLVSGWYCSIVFRLFLDITFVFFRFPYLKQPLGCFYRFHNHGKYREEVISMMVFASRTVIRFSGYSNERFEIQILYCVSDVLTDTDRISRRIGNLFGTHRNDEAVPVC